MIQRIQSLFYFLAALSFGGLFKFPFATSEQPIPEYLADQAYNVQDHTVMVALAALGILVSLVTIFVFKNRPLQLKLGYVVITLSILLPLVAFLLIYGEQTSMSSSTTIEDSLGLYLPVIALICAVLGNRFTKKDDNLVQSMDRLR